MQALTVAISPSGLQYLVQQLIVGQLTSALSGLKPPDKSVPVSDIILSTSTSGSMLVAENIKLNLSGGSLSNFKPTFQSMTQGPNGLFTIVLSASNVTVNYQWNEQYDTYFIYLWINQNQGHTSNTWGYTMGVDTFTITVPITMAQQADTFTYTVGQVTPTLTGLHPNIPGNSIVQQPGPCFTTTVDNTTVQAVGNIDFQAPIQNLLGNLFGTIPASGKLTPDITFNYNRGDTALAFPGNQGLTLGVTGNVTWNNQPFSGGTPPSLAIPSIPTNNHVHFFAADYEFDELFWAFFKDGRLNRTITAGDLPDPGMLNTSYYQNGPLAPLYQKYPNLQMTVDVTPQAAPTVTFKQVYDLTYGDNGVLTTLENVLPTNIYSELHSLAGSVYLTQASYEAALRQALGPDYAQYGPQIEPASLVAGSFVPYQVTQAGLSSLQSQLPAGIYQELAAALTVGQAFVDKAWLLVAVEDALGSLSLANQYAQVIQQAFAAGAVQQVYWITLGTNGALTTLVDEIPADVYNDIVGLANIVYLDQASFVAALQNAIGSTAGQYIAQIETASAVNGAIVTQQVQSVFNVIKAGNTIPVFTVKITETDFQQNFHLGNAGYNQTVQSDFQLISNGTSAQLVKSEIPGIDSSSFPSIWNFVLQPAYALEAQKMARTGVPLPFMTGLRFLFNQATVAVQPGYADVLANVSYFAPNGFLDGLAQGTAQANAALLDGQYTDESWALIPADGQPAMPEPVRMGAAGGRPALHRTKLAAAETRLVRREDHHALATRPRTRRAEEEIPETETFDFHFALGHLTGVEQFDLRAGGGEAIALRAHTEQSLIAHAARNQALALLDDAARSQFTHYVEGVSLSPDVARILRVTYPSATAPIPELALMAVHVPRWARQAHRRRALRRDANGVPVALAVHGVSTRLPFSRALAASLDADLLITTSSTAASVVFYHPQLATSNAQTAARVMDDHINAPDNLTRIQRFQGQISRQGPKWQESVASTDKDGNPLVWGPNFTKTGPVYNTRLSKATVEGAAGAMQLPLTTSQQDLALRNSSWSVNQGTGSVPHVSPEATRVLRAGRAHAKAALAANNGGYAFTLNNLTPGHGLSIDDSSLAFTADHQKPGAGKLSIDVSNDYLRSLYAYAQFLDDHGNVIKVGNADYLPIDVVTPVTVILGIPLPTEPTGLSFDWPATAASARLVHGGLGTSRWDNDLVWPGAILTGIFQYGIPSLFLLAGALLDDTAWFKALEKDKPVVAKLLSLGLDIVGSEIPGPDGFPDVQGFLLSMADAVAGFLVHEGLEKLQAWIVEKLTEAALEDAIPYVDIFFQIANRAVDLVEIAETTVEVLTSPAVYEVDIVRTLGLQATISPDPTHGTQENPAIWPQIAATWETIVQYKGGTAHTQTGSMLGLHKPSDPVTVTFEGLPAGGSLQVKFNVYSATGFLCGQYTSAWQPAVLPDGKQVLAITGAIQENLVPLTAATVYQYKQKLVYNGAATVHQWQPSQFTLDASQASSLDKRQVSAAVATSFADNGCPLDGGATVDVINQGTAWTITDGPVIYRIALKQLLTGPQMVTVLMVSTGNIPLQVVTDLNSSDTGHNLAKLVNITMNDKAYMLGYCWRASGLNIPETGQDFPYPGQIHAFQNINVLANPQSSLKFSPSGFVNQPGLVYDQFGPAPLFRLGNSYLAELDRGGPVGHDLAAVFAAFGYPLPGDAVATVVTAGAAWTIGVPRTTPTYSLARVTDVIEVNPYPTEAYSQRNYYVQPTSDSPSYEYQLRHVILGDDAPFDMKQELSWARFTLPFNDDFVVHPQGYVVAISYDRSRMMIAQLPAEAMPDDKIPAAVIVSGPAGPAGRQGLMNGPKALAVTADGRILVLEQGLPGIGGRIQAFDVNGNPVPSFDGRDVTTVPAGYAADLNAGLASIGLRQAFAEAGAPLSGVWLIQDQASRYQLSEDAGGVVVTSGGANLSLNWTITCAEGKYELSRDGSDIAVARDGTRLFTVPASLAANLNTGITTGEVADAFSQHGVTLTPPVAVAGDGLILDEQASAELAEGKVPASLPPALTVRALPVPANAAVSASVDVTVRDPGTLWTVADRRADISYKIALDPEAKVLRIAEFIPTAPLHDLGQADVTYLSMSTELKGYIYVLSYTGDGSSVTDYRLDIYQPNGPWLARTTGVNAAKVVVDMWRNLYTLNYESLLGPGERTEPSVSTWIPSS
jgi:hypothetical protein